MSFFLGLLETIRRRLPWLVCSSLGPCVPLESMLMTSDGSISLHCDLTAGAGAFFIAGAMFRSFGAMCAFVGFSKCWSFCGRDTIVSFLSFFGAFFALVASSSRFFEFSFCSISGEPDRAWRLFSLLGAWRCGAGLDAVEGVHLGSGYDTRCRFAALPSTSFSAPLA